MRVKGGRASSSVRTSATSAWSRTPRPLSPSPRAPFGPLVTPVPSPLTPWSGSLPAPPGSGRRLRPRSGSSAASHGPTRRPLARGPGLVLPFLFVGTRVPEYLKDPQQKPSGPRRPARDAGAGASVETDSAADASRARGRLPRRAPSGSLRGPTASSRNRPVETPS